MNSNSRLNNKGLCPNFYLPHWYNGGGGGGGEVRGHIGIVHNFCCFMSFLHVVESYGKGPLDSADNSLACHHWLLEGTVYDIMANAFLEDGKLFWNVSGALTLTTLSTKGVLLLSTLSDPKMKQLNTLIGEPATSRPRPEEVSCA